jgi:hypothetical protein
MLFRLFHNHLGDIIRHCAKQFSLALIFFIITYIGSMSMSITPVVAFMLFGRQFALPKLFGSSAR